MKRIFMPSPSLTKGTPFARVQSTFTWYLNGATRVKIKGREIGQLSVVTLTILDDLFLAFKTS